MSNEDQITGLWDIHWLNYQYWDISWFISYTGGPDNEI